MKLIFNASTGAVSSSSASVIPWHPSSPPPPMPDDEIDDKNAKVLDFGFPSDLSGVATSDIGGISTLEDSSSSIVPGMSSLATFDNDDFYSQADLAHQVCICNAI